MSIGLCNGTPEQIESDLDYWIDNVGQLCNWGSFIKSEITSDSLCNSNEVELWNECYSIENTTNLDLSDNQLTGGIPPEIGDLINLNSLQLYNNQLTGEIPPEIGNLINLNSLQLYNNQLTGQIPPEIGSITNLTWLSFAYNQLTGSIPSEIGDLDSLTYLQLGENSLSGLIPEEIGELTSLEILYLYDNQVSGPIPSEIGNCINLETLALNGNEISGEIPPEIGNLTNLIDLQLNDNILTGAIPESICELSNLNWSSSFINWDYSYLYNNLFCPPYPSCIEDYVGAQDTTNCEELTIINKSFPVRYKLYNAYPNPFNPSTTMEFEIGSGRFISLNIYDLNGRLIEEFFIKHLLQGSHKITWEPKNITSGIYFIELLAENFRSTQKLILLK